ncbi:MAG: (d)CMP kinase [Candidatus Woesearchaeota archaeon]
MSITISGIPGSGKSTVSKELAKRFNLKYHSAGTFMREYSKKQGISVEEVNIKAKEDKSFDKAMDDELKKLNNEEGYVIEGRLGALFCKNHFNILLTVSEDVCAKRISKRENIDYKEALKKLRFRRNEERKRYKSIYDFDYEDPSHYDLVIDTSNNTVEDTASIIAKYL